MEEKHENMSGDLGNEGTVGFATIMKRLNDIEQAQEKTCDTISKKIDEKFDELKTQIMKDIDTRLEDFKKQFKEGINKDLDKLKEDCANVQTEVNNLKTQLHTVNNNSQLHEINTETSPLEDINKCVIITNFPHDLNAHLKTNVQEMFEEMDEENLLTNIEILECKRLGNPEHHSKEKPGLLKVALDSLESKKKVLKMKGNLKNTILYKNVWLRSSMTHTDRMMQMNFKTLLKCIPQGKDYRVNANGKVIHKSPPGADDDGADAAEGFQTSWRGHHRGRGSARGGGPFRGGGNGARPSGSRGRGSNRGRPF